MPTLPPVLTPLADSPVTCEKQDKEGKVCGATLMRTGKVATFVDIKRTSRTGAVKGWVPTLLVTICPVCDAGADRTALDAGDVDENKPLALPSPKDKAREEYLNRLDPGRKNIGGESE